MRDTRNSFGVVVQVENLAASISLFESSLPLEALDTVALTARGAVLLLSEPRRFNDNPHDRIRDRTTRPLEEYVALKAQRPQRGFQQ